MKKIGILGGMSWESTAEYYRLINQSVNKKLGGVHSAEMVIFSYDFHRLERLLHQNNWSEISDILVKGASTLKAAGAEILVLATNTAHKVAGKIEDHVDLPLIHIADATGEAILKEGLKTVGLLGTKMTMEEEFYLVRLKEKFGISVVTPDVNDRQYVSDVIFKELVRGKFLDDSKVEYCKIIDKLTQSGAEGVILGCTEIPLLVKPEDTKVNLFDTTAIHTQKIVDVALADD
jgi:aspartate racemase